MWNYNEKVMDHFLHPRNAGELADADAVAEVGNMSCGDALKLYLKVGDDGRIQDVRFQTFGCASAIASSSALTELVKGMTLDEAARVTNRDIVQQLGELPEEKMHCSVMGMEALQAAIADYRQKHGQQQQQQTAAAQQDNSDHEGRIICRCFGVTDAKIRNVVKINHLKTLAEVTEYTKAGGACGACLDQIQQLLDEINREPRSGTDPVETRHPADPAVFAALSTVKKVLFIQDVIDHEIKPALEHDGGSIELVDLVGSDVLVRLQGVCASCPNAKLTLNKFVQDKISEFVSPDLTVREA